jgi:hypothetical protein
VTTPIIPKRLSLPNLSALRDVLNWLTSLSNLSNPFASLDDLRSALELLLNLGSTLGLSSQWLAWLQNIHDNPQLLNLLLAVGQYLENFTEPTQPPTPASALRKQTRYSASATVIDWNNWLAVITEIVQLLEQLWPSD